MTFGDKTSRVIHQVTDKGYRERRKRLGIKDDFGWSDWMNKYAVSPAPESNAPGSDYAGRVATMEWEENFPYTGEYVFRGMADNVGKLYLDNELLIQTGRFGGLNARNIQPQDVLKKTIQEGVHKIKVDLLNYPFKETVRVKPPSNTGTSIEELLISYRGMSEGSGLRRESDTLVRIDDDINPKFDENARFEIKSSTVNAKFSEDGRKILYSGKVGEDISEEEGIKAAEICCINIIAALKKSINGDWDRLDTFLKLGGFVNCNDNFTDQPKIINGASDLLVNIFGDKGRHARFAVGSNALPLNISVEIDAIIKIK